MRLDDMSCSKVGTIDAINANNGRPADAEQQAQPAVQTLLARAPIATPRKELRRPV
jgi:hypothetical protein